MKSRLKALKNKLILIGIKIKEFCKGHKIASGAIALLLVSGVVLSVVLNAADTKDTATVSSVAATLAAPELSGEDTPFDTAHDNRVFNFSTIYYNLSYHIDSIASCSGTCYVDKVIIEATIPDGSQAIWNPTDETTTYSFSDSRKKITIEVPDLQANADHLQVIPLTVLNAANGSTITPSIKIKAGSATTSLTPVTLNKSITTSASRGEAKLTARVVKGLTSSANGQRYGKFGIVLGVDVSSDDITNKEDYASLKGKYISNENTILLNATQGSASPQIKTGENSATSEKSEEQVATENNNFGAYTLNRNLFSPLFMPEISTSGYAKHLKENATDYINNSINPKVTFYGTNNITYYVPTGTSAENYSNLPLDKTYVASGSETPIECVKSNTSTATPRCSYKLVSNGSQYRIEYEYYTENYTATFSRNIAFITATTSLLGPSYDTDVSAPKLRLNKNDINTTVQNILALYGTESNATYKIMNGETQITDINALSEGTTYNLVYYSPGETETIYAEIGLNVVSSPTNLDSRSIEFHNLPTAVIGNPEIYKNKICDYVANKNPGTMFSCSASSSGNTLTTTLAASSLKLDFNTSMTVSVFNYELLLKNIGYTGALTYVPNIGMYALGTYFVTTDLAENDSDLCLSASYKINGTASDASNLCVSSTSTSNGSNDTYNNVYVLEDGEYVRVDDDSLTGRYYTAGMGEEIQQEVIFRYGYDASSNLSELKAIIPVDERFITPIAYSDTIGNSSLNNNFAHVDKLNETISGSTAEAFVFGGTQEKPCTSNLCYTVKYYSGTTQYNPENQNYSGVNKIEVALVDNGSTKVLTPGTTVRITLRYKVNSIGETQYETYASSGQNAINFLGAANASAESGKFTLKTVSAQEFTQTFPSTHKVYITPYKLRSTVKFGKYSDDDNNVLTEVDEMTFDASKNDTYTGVVFPDVISPALDISSTAFGYSAIDKIPLKVILPAGINYVYNQNYNVTKPVVTYNNTTGTTTLTYDYYGVEPNSWIEPFYFDFNIDINTQTTTKDIVIELGDGNKVGIEKDFSDDRYLKKTYRMNIENTYSIAYGQYLYDTTSANAHYISNADVNENFVQTIKIRNNNITSGSGAVTVVGLVPNPTTSTVTSYNGAFDVTLPSNAVCAYSSKVTADELANKTSLSTIINDSTKWDSCTTSDNLVGYKITFDNIANGSESHANIVYTVKDNAPADIYEFSAFVYNSKANYSHVAMHRVSLEVISKKIRGVVFEDFVVNGIKDDNEKTIENVVLNLYDSTNNQVIKTTTSNKNGIYTFAGLKEGTYYVVADFNREKYGLTTQPSQDFYDRTRISVFKQDGTTVANTTSSDTNTGSQENSTNTSEVAETIGTVKTDNIEIKSETRVYDYVNLGLSPRKKFKPKITKYVSKAIVTDALGVQTIKDYNNAKLAKLDVRNLDKVSIKVVYTLEIQNILYYPGYVKKITEMIPMGMSFNESYEENKDWKLTEDGVLENTTLAKTQLNENDKKYITIAFDITSKEAGSFVNVASIDDLQILGGEIDE